VNVPERTDQTFDQPINAVGPVWLIGLCELMIYPSNQVTISDVPDEQKQSIGGLVEATIPEFVPWQWAAREMLRLITRTSELAITTIRKCPIAVQFLAGGALKALLLSRPSLEVRAARCNCLRSRPRCPES
jgi:hypothetical protein